MSGFETNMFCSICRVMCAAITLPLTPVACWAGEGMEWNQWRGPLRNEVVLESPVIADVWGDAGPAKVWDSEPFPGKRHGFGSVVVAGGRSYIYVNWRYEDPVLLSADALEEHADAIPPGVVKTLEGIKDIELPTLDALDDWIDLAGIEREVKREILSWIPEREVVGMDVVLCLDPGSGETLWRFEQTGGAPDWGGSSTPCVVDDRLYVVGSDADLYCLDANAGEKVWQRKIGAGVKHTSVSVAEGKVVAAVGPLTAVEAESGEIVWQQEDVPGTDASPSIGQYEEKTYLLCNSKKKLSCVDLVDGSILWDVPGGNSSSAAVSGDYMIVFTGPQGLGLAAYRLSPLGAEELWTVEHSNRESSPVIHDGHVYAVGGGKASSVDLVSGEIRWQVDAHTDMTSPVVVDGKIIFSSPNTLTMFSASPEKYTLLGSANLPVYRCVSPAVADGKLFMRMAAGVKCYDLTTAP